MAAYPNQPLVVPILHVRYRCPRLMDSPSHSLCDLRTCSAASGSEKARDVCEGGTGRATSTVPYRLLAGVSNAGRWTGDDEMYLPYMEISPLAGSGLA